MIDTKVSGLELQTAKELHKFYRASMKALNGPSIAQLHDHGWEACRRQKYFIFRAKMFLRTLPHDPRPTLDSLRELQRIAAGPCTCDGGNTNGCSACVAERKLRNLGR